MGVFAGFALLRDKLVIADEREMKISSFLVPESDRNQIMSDLALGKRDTINRVAQPLHEEKLTDQGDLTIAFCREVNTALTTEGKWNPGVHQGSKEQIHA